MTTPTNTLSATQKDASSFTKEYNKKVATSPIFKNDTGASFVAAQRGFRKPPVETLDPPLDYIPNNPPYPIIIKNSENRAVWNLEPYQSQIQSNPPPATVNPSLWHQASLNTLNGLFEVTDGMDVENRIYQVRAFDMSNMTIIEGKEGLIIIDPLISCECSQKALALYRAYQQEQAPNTPPRAVKVVIFTHSHVDHFGGVLGLFSSQKEQDDAKIVAPAGFLDHAVSENVYAGTAMTRRAQYMYGPYLQKSDKGQVDVGLGKDQSTGRVSILQPKLSIDNTNSLQEDLDGLTVEFFMTPGAEAPSEFCCHFPSIGALCAAEDASHTMHNIQTLRGARVRDSLNWSKYLSGLLEAYGDPAKTQVVFGQHHWPVWNTPEAPTAIPDFLARQRDMYRYLNDQTLRMLNKGYTGIEIAEIFKMPPALDQDWSCRGYYGTVSHNVKAVYDFYMGWFNGNPSDLHPLPPAESSPKYLDLMGGVCKVIEAAKTAAEEEGNYRWAAELLNKVLFVYPNLKEARLLQADVLEQMGYQAESGPWRNFYLMGAQELRNLDQESGGTTAGKTTTDPSMIQSMTIDMIFDSLGARLIAPHMVAQGIEKLVMNWTFTYPENPKKNSDQYAVTVVNGAMSYVQGRLDSNAGVSITMPRTIFDQLLTEQISPSEAISTGKISHQGNLLVLAQFFSLLDDGVPDFPIVTPRPPAEGAWNPPLPKVRAWQGIADKVQDSEALNRRYNVIGTVLRSR